MFFIAVAPWQGAGAHDPGPTAAPPPDFPVRFGGPFSLLDQDGVRRTDRDFRGRFLLVYFGYTHCPDICLTGLDTVAAALDLLGEAAGRVQPLFISIDPERDTPERLKSYLHKFHPRLVGLTGSEAEIGAVAKAYRVHRKKVLVPGEPLGDYLASHSSITYLMGPEGEFVSLYPHGTEPEFMAGAIRRHISG